MGIAKHTFPENWFEPELEVRFMTSDGLLWNCQTGDTGLSVGRPVELGDVS